MTFSQDIWPIEFLSRHLTKWLLAKAFEQMTFSQGIWPNDIQSRHLNKWPSAKVFDQMTFSQGIWTNDLQPRHSTNWLSTEWHSTLLPGWSHLSDVPIGLNLGRKSLFLMVPQRFSKRHIYERHVFDEHVLDYTIIGIYVWVQRKWDPYETFE